jgi:hypothetical protein
VAGVTVRLVRERMQALSSRYGRVLVIGTLLHGLSVSL